MKSLLEIALFAWFSSGKATIIVPVCTRPESRLSFGVAQQDLPTGVSPVLKIDISSATSSELRQPSSVLKSLIGILCIATLYQGSPFLRLVTKGSTPLITASFSIKKSTLNRGVVVITILPRSKREVVETTRSLKPFSLKALLIRLHREIEENFQADSLSVYRRVYLLEGANLLCSLSFLAFTIENLELVALALFLQVLLLLVLLDIVLLTQV